MEFRWTIKQMGRFLSRLQEIGYKEIVNRNDQHIIYQKGGKFVRLDFVDPGVYKIYSS